MKARSILRAISVLLLVLLALLATAAALAQPYPATARVANIRLWPGVAPGSRDAPMVTKYAVYGNQGHRVFWNIGTPVMAAFYAAKPNGTAVLIIPGGGYRQLYVDSPPVDAAHWLNTLGIDAFVLMHRLPDEGHARGYNVPLQDAQRALRLIRESKALEGLEHKINPAHIGVMGFSAGGHLGAVLGAYYDAKVYDAVDGAEGISARPDFMILGYAALGMPPTVVESMMPNYYRLYQKFPAVVGVNSQTPPAFLFHGDHDSDVPHLLSVRLAGALKDASVPVELHIFPGTGHGFGMNGKGPEAAWPGLCAAWLRARGFLPAEKASAAVP